MSIRSIAAVSATAVTAVGSAMGVASSAAAQNSGVETAAQDLGLFTEISEAHSGVQATSLNHQADTQATAADAEHRKEAEAAARRHAAREAIAKKAAAEKEAILDREGADLAASQSAAQSEVSLLPQTSYSVAQIQAMARQMVAADQYQCMSQIVSHESGWNYQAVNASSGAYGLFQALPGTKMSTAGSDWRTNPRTQIKWGLNYMTERYGDACGAWDFWQANNWY